MEYHMGVGNKAKHRPLVFVQWHINGKAAHKVRLGQADAAITDQKQTDW